MSAIKKVLAKVTSPTSPTTSTAAHNGDAAASPTSPTRSRSPSAEAPPSHRSSTVDPDHRESRKPNRVSTLLSHIRSHSHSKTRDPASPAHQNGDAHLTNGGAHADASHGDTVHAHEIVRPSTQRRMSMTEEKGARKQEREFQEDREAEDRRKRHLEAWKNVRAFSPCDGVLGAARGDIAFALSGGERSRLAPA